MSSDFNLLVMSNGTEYRVLIDHDELVQMVDSALKEGGLLTVPMGISKPGSLKAINPSHVVAIDNMQRF